MSRIVAQALAVAGVAEPGGVAFTTEPAKCRQPVQIGVGQPGAELRVEYLYFPGDGLGNQPGPGQHVHQSGEALIGLVRRQVQVYVGNGVVGTCVVAPAPLADPARQLACLGIAGRTQEQGMLEQVGQAAAVVGLVQVAHSHRADQALQARVGHFRCSDPQPAWQLHLLQAAARRQPRAAGRVIVERGRGVHWRQNTRDSCTLRRVSASMARVAVSASRRAASIKW